MGLGLYFRRLKTTLKNLDATSQDRCSASAFYFNLVAESFALGFVK